MRQEDYAVNSSGLTVPQLAQAVQDLIDKNHITNITSITVYDHGEPGNQYLIAPWFSVEEDPDFKKITDHIKANGTLYLTGCNVAEGDKGLAYLKMLAKYFQRNVVASTAETNGANGSTQNPPNSLIGVHPDGTTY